MVELLHNFSRHKDELVFSQNSSRFLDVSLNKGEPICSNTDNPLDVLI